MLYIILNFSLYCTNVDLGLELLHNPGARFRVHKNYIMDFVNEIILKLYGKDNNFILKTDKINI